MAVMEYQKLIVERQDGIGVIRINHPDALNALNTLVLSELGKAFDAFAADESVEVVVLTGEGRAFVAGADIAEMMPQPVIAAVNGFALGGGCELAMACDIRIASSKAKFGQPEVGLGITPGFSGTQRLPRLVGLGKAKELIYTAAVIPADEACRIGLVNRVVEPGALMDEALALAAAIASKARLAVRYAKEAINRGIETDIETGIDMETSLFGLCFATHDQKEGMAAFLQKRKPDFTGS